MCAVACARVRCSVRDGVCARKHPADASRASRQSHLTASPVYESSEGGEESAYDDRMSLEHLCATCRAARSHARRASGHSCQPAAARSAFRRLQSLHWLLTRRWAQMEAPPQSTHLLLRRLCSQMEAPPQSLHVLLSRLRSQMARRDAEPWRSVERTRHESGGRHRRALCPACPERNAADAGPQTTAELAVVALYPDSSDQRSCFFGSSRDGASNEARASPLRAPERRGEPGPGRDTWP
jgi:hypothetical protein